MKTRYFLFCLCLLLTCRISAQSNNVYAQSSFPPGYSIEYKKKLQGVKKTSTNKWAIQPVYDKIVVSEYGTEFYAYKSVLNHSVSRWEHYIDVYRLSDNCPLIPVLENVSEISIFKLYHGKQAYTVFTKNGKKNWFTSNDYPGVTMFDEIREFTPWGDNGYVTTITNGLMEIYELDSRQKITDYGNAVSCDKILVTDGPETAWYLVRNNRNKFRLTTYQPNADRTSCQVNTFADEYDTAMVISPTQIAAAVSGSKEFDIYQNGTKQGRYTAEKVKALMAGFEAEKAKEKYQDIVSNGVLSKTMADMEIYSLNGILGMKSNGKEILPASALKIYMLINYQQLKISTSRLGDTVIVENPQGKQRIYGHVKLIDFIQPGNRCDDVKVMAQVGCIYNNKLYFVQAKIDPGTSNEKITPVKVPLDFCTSLSQWRNEFSYLNPVCPVCHDNNCLVVGSYTDTTVRKREVLVQKGNSVSSNYSYGGYTIDAHGNVKTYTVTDAHSVPRYELETREIVTINEHDITEPCPLVSVTKYTQTEYTQRVEKKRYDHNLQADWDKNRKLYILRKLY